MQFNLTKDYYIMMDGILNFDDMQSGNESNKS